jgi:hypothetical protein
MAQRMNECTALDLMMDEDVDWNDSEDDEESGNDTYSQLQDIPEPLDVAQVDEDDGETDDLDESDRSITILHPHPPLHYPLSLSLLVLHCRILQALQHR